MFGALAGELAVHGGDALRYSHTTVKDEQVGRWACQQRSLHRARRLRTDRAQALSQLPHWSWEYRQPHREQAA